MWPACDTAHTHMHEVADHGSAVVSDHVTDASHCCVLVFVNTSSRQPSTMSNTDGKESGVYAWMASVRASMDNDSSRQIFENQVQSHAFIFLDNYLEHILAGPKQGQVLVPYSFGDVTELAVQ